MESCLKVEVNVMFSQAGKYAQMNVPRSIKIEQEAVAGMVQEFKQLNNGAVPGKLVIGMINHKSISNRKEKI